MALILMRHPPPAVAAGTCYGMTDLDLVDPPEGPALRAGLPEFARIVSSPLRRCRLAAEAIAAASALEIEIDQRLREMDFGAWEGLAWSAIPRAELDAWRDDFDHARPHGGESVAMLSARVDEALAAHRAEGAATLLVTHSGVIKAATRNWRLDVGFANHVVI